MVIFTTVDASGKINRYEYDNRSCKFFKNGEPVHIQFGDQTAQQNQNVRQKNIHPVFGDILRKLSDPTITDSDIVHTLDYVVGDEAKVYSFTKAQMISALFDTNSSYDERADIRFWVDDPKVEENAKIAVVKVAGARLRTKPELVEWLKKEDERLGRKVEKTKQLNRDYALHKDHDIRSMKIQLGLGCNYSCSYCIQAIHVQKAAMTNLKDVEEFIANFDTWCHTPKDAPIDIQLWGGEPLAYFAKIKKLVPFLRGRFNNLRLSVLSNGSLVDEEIVDYLIENDIVLAISHDGPGQMTYRTGDPIAPDSKSLPWIREYIKRSKVPLYTNGVLTKQNQDPKAVVDHIRGILGQNVRVGFEGIVTVEDIKQFNKDSLFSPEEYAELRENLKSSYLRGDLSEIGLFTDKFNNFIAAWTNPNFVIEEQSASKCGMDDAHTIAVDLKGNTLVCHSGDEQIGHTKNWDDITMTRHTRHWRERQECRTCPVLSSCRGACMKTEGIEREESCKNEWNLNMSMFEAAFQVVFGEAIVQVEIEPEAPNDSAKVDESCCGSGCGCHDETVASLS